MIPSYTEILTLGSSGTELIFNGPVVIQEKVDGSQFRFGKNADGELVFASHHADIYTETCPKEFRLAVDHIESVWHQADPPPDTYFYCEYLAKPRHNTLAYDQVPKNHLVLFGGSSSGFYFAEPDIRHWADRLNIDAIPELYAGVATVDQAKGFLTTTSYLGGPLIEGVVIKNYTQQLMIRGRLQPLFAKLVRDDFKERNGAEWKGKKGGKGEIQSFVDSFNTEARMRKAVQHLSEAGELEHSPRDIGKLMKAVYEDVVNEETPDIKEGLYKLYIKQIVRAAQRGLPEWYKAQLIDRIEE